jgi:subtilisin-like proprotein convertase family protein
VQQALAKTARRNDPTDSEWTFNFGLFHNPKYGFGTVDAAAAVSYVAAPSWVSVGDSSSLVSCGPYTSSPNAPLADATQQAGTGNILVTPVNDAISVSDCAITRIEFVEVILNAAHSYGGDLRVSLTSPNGLVSTFASERICAGASGQDNCGAYDDWQFGSVRHLDEPAGGSWTLTLADAQLDDVGTFQNWSLRFFGR